LLMLTRWTRYEVFWEVVTGGLCLDPQELLFLKEVYMFTTHPLLISWKKVNLKAVIGYLKIISLSLRSDYRTCFMKETWDFIIFLEHEAMNLMLGYFSLPAPLDL
jgi:hypothetical protein